MKKTMKYPILLILAFLILLLCSCNDLSGYVAFNDEIKLYYIREDESADDFFNNPSINKINKLSEEENKLKILIYKKYVQDSNEIIYNNDEQIIKFIRYYEMSADMFNLLNNRDSINTYIKNNYGIYDDVQYTAVISAYNYPDTIWLKCSKNDYYMVEETGDVKYSFYTVKEYLNEFAPAKAQLFVYGNKIETNYAKVGYKYSYLPLLETLKALGANVEWRNNTNVVDVTIGYEKYVIDAENRYFNKYGLEFDYNDEYAGGGLKLFKYDTKHREIIVNDNYIYNILNNVFAAKMYIDDESNTISIISKNHE